MAQQPSFLAGALYVFVPTALGHGPAALRMCVSSGFSEVAEGTVRMAQTAALYAGRQFFEILAKAAVLMQLV